MSNKKKNIYDVALNIAKTQAFIYSQRFSVEERELYSLAISKLPLIISKIDQKRNPEAFITTSIRGYILNYFRDNSSILKIDRRYTNIYMKIQKLKECSPEISEKQICIELDISEQEFIEASNIMRIKYMNLNEENNSEKYSVEVKDYQNDKLDYLKNLDENQKALLTDYYLGAYPPEFFEDKYQMCYNDVITFCENQKSYLEDL